MAAGQPFHRREGASARRQAGYGKHVKDTENADANGSNRLQPGIAPRLAVPLPGGIHYAAFTHITGSIERAEQGCRLPEQQYTNRRTMHVEVG